ncbi:MAG: bifunctional 2-polyprenyl-6-hydroxyphenol methylase/3-demethylubiquinol 3-O-methyltransferase UbiG [Pseudomonadota bacterium]
MSASLDKQEIKRFQKTSNKWWDEQGPFKPLHKLNPTRLAYFKKQICDHFDRDENTANSYKGLSIIDVGCGGGLVCEPMARLGGKVTGIDADEQAIGVAKDHAKASRLKIDYKSITAEELVAKKKQYDVVLALEIIEHVKDQKTFVETICSLCKPGGLIIFSTLNRNPKSFALGIVAAEYILRWLPKGTHNWKKFLKPSELSKFVRESNAVPHDITGLVYNPLHNEFSLSKSDLDVNYFLTAKQPSKS